MSKQIKIAISSLIFILLLLATYFFILNFNIQYKFINTNLEVKYQDDLKKISQKIENFFILEQKKIDQQISQIDFSKFSSKQAARKARLNNELNLFQTLVINEDLLKKVKFVNMKKELLFSTDHAETIQNNRFISFKSIDQVEKQPALLHSGQKTPFLILDDFILLKKKIKLNDQASAVLLFYYSKSVFDQLLHNIEFFNFKNLFYFENNILLLNKPLELPPEKLTIDLFNQRNKVVIVETIKNQNELIKSKYRTFYHNLNHFDLVITRFENNSKFQLNNLSIFIGLFLFLSSIYLLILFLILLKRSEIDRAKEKLSLYTTTLLEDMLGAGSKEELEKLYDNIYEKKQFILKNLYLNFRKLKTDEKKNLEEELDIVLKKIENTLNRQIEKYYAGAHLPQFEKMMENFMTTINEKGISLKSNFQKETGPGEAEELEDVEELHEVEELEDIEELDEVEELEDVEELDEVEEAEELEDAEELDEVEEAENLEDAGKPDEVGETEDQQDAEEREEIAQAEELENAEEPDEIGETEDQQDTEKAARTEAEKEPDHVEPSLEREAGEEAVNTTMQADRTEAEKPEHREIKAAADNDPAAETGLEENELQEDEKEMNEKEQNTENEYDLVDKLMSIEDFPNIELNDAPPDLQHLADLKQSFRHSQSPDQSKNDNDKPLQEELSELDEAIEELEELPEDDEAIPTIPDDFYQQNSNVQNKQLAQDIDELLQEKTMLQKLLDQLYQQMSASKLSLMIQINNQGSFIQTYQIGFDQRKIEKFILDNNNMIVNHIYKTERVVYVSEFNKLNSLFENKILENEFDQIESMIIYPVKILRKIRALIFLGFDDEARERIELFIDFIKTNSDALHSNIAKII